MSDVPWPQSTWPQATMSEVAHLRMLAAGMPAATLRERTFDVPFATAWGFVADLEHSVPRFDRTVRRLRIVERRPDRDGERLRALTSTWWWYLGLPVPFDIELRPGWCLMVSRPRFYVVGMAAEPDGDRTRYAQLEGLTVPTRRPARWLAAPLSAAARRWHDRHIAHDLDGIERELRAG